ncbi:MAG: FAD-binding oxidoreductase [Gammaproteobacteria bacterium]|nr:FAD-binding oxidoreductase [Gammaproteobacteria bacterium]
MTSQTRIAGIGAVIVGCSCALWLQKKGFAVTLIDPEDPGSGTSSGNACTIAEYGCIPVNSPDLFRRLPSLLFSSDSPLSLNPGYVLSHPAWMIEFLLNCRKHKVERIIRVLGKLLARVYDGLDPLLDMAGARDLLAQQGFMHVYVNQQEFNAAKPSNQMRREQGSEFVELDRGDIQDLEPNLKFPFERGLLFDSISHVLDPLALCQRYAECFKRNQGQLLRQRALEVVHGAGSVQIRLDNGETVGAERVVIAAGAFSKSIDGIPTGLLKLDTERGYHIQFGNMQHLVKRPVSWHHAGFYATPTNLGLRFAGTVEIAGNDKEKNPRIISYLNRKAHEMFELPEHPDQEWLGFRPTCPDALPVIGYSTASEYILYAFGHHHLGLTLAGITGKLIAELANGEEPSHNITPFSPRRFL